MMFVVKKPIEFWPWVLRKGLKAWKKKIFFPIPRKEVPDRVRDFKPELIFWVFGLDTHKASYGTATLTERCYPKLAEIIKETADQVCDGRLIVKTPCNAPGWVKGYVLPRIVDSLAELRKYEEPLV